MLSRIVSSRLALAASFALACGPHLEDVELLGVGARKLVEVPLEVVVGVRGLVARPG